MKNLLHEFRNQISLPSMSLGYFKGMSGMKSIGWLLLISCFAGNIHAQDISGTLTFDGKARTYLLHVPPGYNPSQPIPLVLVFHALNSTPSQMAGITEFSPLADAENFMVVYPGGLNKRWASPDGATDDVGFTSALIDKLTTDYNIDPNRIYAAGYSNGGMFTYRVALELTDRIAAVGIVSGYLPTYDPLPAPAPSRAISVVHFHGTSDNVIPYDRADDAADFWIDVDACNPDPLTTILPNADITDGTTVDKISYSGGTDQSEVNIYKIYNGGHTWPGTDNTNIILGKVCRDIDASEIMWEFFVAHPMSIRPVVSITSPVDGAAFTAPATFRIRATATDADGSISKVEFFNGEELLKSDLTYQYGYEWNDVEAGIYTIAAVATDNEGEAATDVITITVNPAKLTSTSTENIAVNVIYDQAGEQIIIDKSMVTGEYDFSVYDLPGKELFSLKNLSDGKKVIQMQSFEAGIYFYTVRMNNDQRLSGKFIISH